MWPALESPIYGLRHDVLNLRKRHAKHSDGQVDAYTRFSRTHGLLITAGSDCHHGHEYANLLGVHKGEDGWIEDVLGALDA